MQDSEKRAKLKKPQKTGGSGSQSASQDPTSQKLAKIAGAVGNNAVQSQFAISNASRDEMLHYLTHRLASIDQVQQQEVEACGYNQMRENWKEIADSQREDIRKPDPTKWSESAMLYERAAFKLCNGEIGSGSQLLRNAMNAEQAAFEKVSSTIDLSKVQEASAQAEVIGNVQIDQTSQPCDLPEGIELADKIQAVTTTVKESPDNPRVAIPWWTDLEEDEEGEGEGAESNS